MAGNTDPVFYMGVIMMEKGEGMEKVEKGSDPNFRFSPRPNRAAEINWREWGRGAFAEAEREEKLLLLSISAVWCHWCHVMDETTYSDPEVIRLINENFIPVRVDNDRRPEINRRYNQGGWPSTVFLEPHGNVLAGATYIPPENMRQVIDRFIGLWRDKRTEISGKIEEAIKEAIRSPATGTAGETGSRLHRNIREDVWRAVVRAQDREHGGLGDAPKFPMFDVMELALDVYLDRHNPSALAWLLLTADNMLGGGTYDLEEGGLFRYSTTRDWSVPHFEKMLADNARMARMLLRLWLLNGKQLYASRAAHILDYVDRTLGDGKGGFYGSQDADEHYYVLDLAARAGQDVPFVDHTVYIDSEALAVEAFMEAGEILGEGPLSRTGPGRAAAADGPALRRDRHAPLPGRRGRSRPGTAGRPGHHPVRPVEGLSAIDRRPGRPGKSGRPGRHHPRPLLGLSGQGARGHRPAHRTRHGRPPAGRDRHGVTNSRSPAGPGENDGTQRDEGDGPRSSEAYSNDYLLFSFHAAPYARAADLQLSGFRTVMLRGEGRGAEYAGLRRAALLSPLPRLLVIPGGII